MSAPKAKGQPKAPTKTLAAQRREAVERAFPGVICKRVAYECAHRPAAADDYFPRWVDGKKFCLNLTVEASAETLVAHGLVEQRAIDSLPPSGRRYGLEKTNRGTYQASVHYFEGSDTPTVARDMAARIGIPGLPQHRVYSAEKGWHRVEAEPAKSRGNVIQFPRKNPRAISPEDSCLADTTTVRGCIAIYVPADLRANVIGAALASIGLRTTTDGGKLVARWDAQEGRQ